MSFDLNDPTTWSFDDPALWMHEQWYRKMHSLPDDTVISGYPQPPKQTQKFAGRRVNKRGVALTPSRPNELPVRLASRRVNPMTVARTPSQPSDSTFRIVGENVTSEELLRGAKNTKRSFSEEYYMKKNGDPLGDLEADWWEQYNDFLDDPALVDENDPFTLWNAKQHHKMDLKCKRKLASDKTRADTSGSSAQSQRPGSGLPIKAGVPGKICNQKNEVINLVELKTDLQQLTDILLFRLFEYCQQLPILPLMDQRSISCVVRRM